MSAKRIAIIGAGPAGLAAAKAIGLESSKFEVDVFERRSDVGGLWLFDGAKPSALPSVPSTDPNGSEHIFEGSSNMYFSSMYNNLKTNLTADLMEYSGVSFEPQTQDFVDRKQVLAYLRKYSRGIPDTVKMHFSTSVISVSKNSHLSWKVRTENVCTLEISEAEYDAVVVANGHAELPYIPGIPGIREWSESDPWSVTHSRYFTDSKGFRDKTVLVVGNFASGQDLATQIGTSAKLVYVSSKDENPQSSEFEYIENIGSIDRYDVASRSAHTIDGKTVVGIDVIVFCTGYLYTFPFLEPAISITDGTYVQDLYKQLFYVHDPSLSFIGLPKFISPLPLSESQSAVVARVLSGRMSLPAPDQLKAEYLEEVAVKGANRNFQSLKDSDYVYCNELYDWIVESGTHHSGLMPIYWDKQKVQKRLDVEDAKKRRADLVKAHADYLRSQGKDFTFP